MLLKTFLGGQIAVFTLLYVVFLTSLLILLIFLDIMVPFIEINVEDQKTASSQTSHQISGNAMKAMT